MNKFQEILKIADIHASRMIFCLEKIGHLFPLTAEKVDTLTDEEILLLDSLTFRFGKLQDYIGSKAIDAFLEEQAENTTNLTMIDKLHKLEIFDIVVEKEMWKEIREIRNHVAHEYPDNPELTAEHLNK